jgi:hypothetical protein
LAAQRPVAGVSEQRGNLAADFFVGYGGKTVGAVLSRLTTECVEMSFDAHSSRILR